MGEDVIEYFKAMAEETGIPYQSLINLYLRDCVARNRKVNINWLKRALQRLPSDAKTATLKPVVSQLT
jgi:hypothetical protein